MALHGLQTCVRDERLCRIAASQISTCFAPYSILQECQKVIDINYIEVRFNYIDFKVYLNRLYLQYVSRETYLFQNILFITLYSRF